MTIDEILSTPSAFIGREVLVRGHLVSDLATVLVSSGNTSSQILLKHPHIQERLLEVVPCYVGCCALYSDESRVTGRLAVENGGYVLYPSTVEILREDEAPYVVQLVS